MERVQRRGTKTGKERKAVLLTNRNFELHLWRAIAFKIRYHDISMTSFIYHDII